jgi:hypothetical protein
MPCTLNRLVVHNELSFYIPVIELKVHKLDLLLANKNLLEKLTYIIPKIDGIVGYSKTEKTARSILQHL